MKKLDKKEALSRVQFICSKQEKCCSEIRKKLQSWGINSQEQEEIIDSLIDDKFIDENRFTPVFVRDKFRFNRWGRIKIAYHLRQKQIPSDIIENALQEIDEQEYISTLTNLLQSKLKGLKEVDKYQLKAKLLRFIQSRGFESNLANNIIEELLEQNNK